MYDFGRDYHVIPEVLLLKSLQPSLQVWGISIKVFLQNIYKQEGLIYVPLASDDWTSKEKFRFSVENVLFSGVLLQNATSLFATS